MGQAPSPDQRAGRSVLNKKPDIQERIFPTWPPGQNRLARTGFVGGWAAQFFGIGRAVAKVLDGLFRSGGAIDDAALTVVYLQRQRLEVGLKLLLERSGTRPSAFTRTHDLKELRALCQTALEAKGMGGAWRSFLAEGGALIDVLAEADPGGALFRYPLTSRAESIARPPLVDLEELQAEALRFEAGSLALIDELARLEGLPIDSSELEASASELGAAIDAIEAIDATLAKSEQKLASFGARFGLLTPERSAPEVNAQLAQAEALAMAAALKHQLQLYLELAAAGLDSSPAGFRIQQAITSEPAHTPGATSLIAPKERKRAIAELDRLIDQTGEELGRAFRDLGTTLQTVYERSEDWPGVACRQLHLDLGRFLSRLYLTFPPGPG